MASVNPAAQARLKRANERLRRCEQARQRVQRDKPSNSALYHLIKLVWSLPRRPKQTGNEQVDAENQLEWASLPYYERELAKRLLQAVVGCDVDTLKEVAQIAYHDEFEPISRLQGCLLDYFRHHDTGTLEELRGWVAKRLGWVWDEEDHFKRCRAYDRQIERACDHNHLDFPIAESKRKGRKPGPKRPK